MLRRFSRSITVVPEGFFDVQRMLSRASRAGGFGVEPVFVRQIKLYFIFLKLKFFPIDNRSPPWYVGIVVNRYSN